MCKLHTTHVTHYTRYIYLYFHCFYILHMLHLLLFLLFSYDYICCTIQFLCYPPNWLLLVLVWLCIVCTLLKLGMVCWFVYSEITFASVGLVVLSTLYSLLLLLSALLLGYLFVVHLPQCLHSFDLNLMHFIFFPLSFPLLFDVSLSNSMNSFITSIQTYIIKISNSSIINAMLFPLCWFTMLVDNFPLVILTYWLMGTFVPFGYPPHYDCLKLKIVLRALD